MSHIKHMIQRWLWRNWKRKCAIMHHTFGWNEWHFSSLVSVSIKVNWKLQNYLQGFGIRDQEFIGFLRELYDERIEFFLTSVWSIERLGFLGRLWYFSFAITLISLRQLNEKAPPRNYNNDKPMEWGGFIDTIFAIIKIFVHLIQKYFEMFTQLG